MNEIEQIGEELKSLAAAKREWLMEILRDAAGNLQATGEWIVPDSDTARSPLLMSFFRGLFEHVMESTRTN